MSRRVKMTVGSDNVFRDLGFPDAEAQNLLLRAELMSKVRDAARGMTQVQAAKRFGVTQPRINDLLKGKIERFSLDALVNMLAAAGMRVEVRVKKAA
jgi:predicted XRE-type DNA-binding protein